MPEAGGEPKKVPKRVDVKPQGLIRNNGQVDPYGKDPDFVYHSFSRDPKSPGYFGNFDHPHYYGEGQTWGQWIGPWESVNAITSPNTVQPAVSTAQGHPIDTVQRGAGDQLLFRIHKSEYAKYRETDRANNDERAKHLGTPDIQRGSLQSTTTVLSDGADVDPTQALLAAGHPMPGMNHSRQ